MVSEQVQTAGRARGPFSIVIRVNILLLLLKAPYHRSIQPEFFLALHIVMGHDHSSPFFFNDFHVLYKQKFSKSEFFRLDSVAFYFSLFLLHCISVNYHGVENA